MIEDIEKYLEPLVNANLINDSERQRVAAEFECQEDSPKTVSEQLFSWLVERKIISSFHHRICNLGYQGSFRYGNYQVVEPLETGPSDCFVARHSLTRHPVELQFFGGSDARSLENWRAAQDIARRLIGIEHDAIKRVFETVAIPEYRFVVREFAGGRQLNQIFSAKSRVENDKAIEIVYQLAGAFGVLQEIGIELGDDFESCLWMQRNGRVFVDVPLNSVPQPIEGGDLVTGLGILWYRMVGARPPQIADRAEAKQELSRLRKFAVPLNSIKFLIRILDVESASPDWGQIQNFCLQELPDLNDKSFNVGSKTLTDFKNWLDRSPELGVIAPIESIDDRQLNFGLDSARRGAIIDGPEVAENSDQLVGKTRLPRRRAVLWPIVGSTIGLAAVMLAIAVTTTNIPVASKKINRENAVAAATNPNSGTESKDVSADSAGPVGQLNKPVVLNQVLVEDDGDSLWESPTSGPPIVLSYVPNAPKIILIVRLAEWMSTESGRQSIVALGPVAGELIQELLDELSLPIEYVEQLLISFHSNEEYAYDAFYRIRLAPDFDIASWEQQMSENAATRTFEETSYFLADDLFASTCLSAGQPTIIAGQQSLLLESLGFAGLDVSTGALNRLAGLTDDERHLNILFLRSSLFNDEGQRLMGLQLRPINRELSLVISPYIRGVAISMHVDHGTYFEMRFDQSVDLKSEQWKSDLKALLVDSRDRIVGFVQSFSPDGYWDNLRSRIAAMADDFVAGIRIGIEEKRVVANGWYSEFAAPNWFAATEHVLTFAPYQKVPDQSHTHTVMPQNLAELLMTRRDLVINTAPDLINLLRDLEDDVNSEFNQMPFKFRIELIGVELSKEGITQNQRLGQLALRNQSLSEVLTEIMIQANPDKNITGASDPNCKLVWAISSDPESPDNEMIVITTRQAAESGGLTLPTAFESGQ